MVRHNTIKKIEIRINEYENKLKTLSLLASEIAHFSLPTKSWGKFEK